MPEAGPAPSDALVFFGATGDLAHKKVFPAPYALSKRGGLDIPVIGVALSDRGVEQLRERARDSVRTFGGGIDDSKAMDNLLARLRYVDGNYADQATFTRLRDALSDARRPVHYLAVPPSLFETVIRNLGEAGCARGARIVVEKPFGRDLASARELNRVVHTVFPEETIFRIDHFLGKEAIVALVAMEPPVGSGYERERDEKAKVFRAMTPLEPDDLVRGQFQGYREEPGVAPDSDVETYAAVRLYIDTWRWQGVPFFLRSGKKLKVTATEVLVELAITLGRCGVPTRPAAFRRHRHSRIR